jgi:hypothetical protein
MYIILHRAQALCSFLAYAEQSFEDFFWTQPMNINNHLDAQPVEDLRQGKM